MRILALQETDWVERNPIMHHRMLEELSRRGDHVTVIDYDLHWRSAAGSRITTQRRAGTATGKYYNDARVMLIRPRVVRQPGLTRLSWLAANWREVSRELSRNRPDVVVGYGISNALLGVRLAKQAGVPFVYHLLDALHTLVEPAILRPVARQVERMALQQADMVIVINRHLQSYAEGMGAQPQRIRVLPQGYSPRSVAPGEQARVRDLLDVDEAELLLLFVGWLYQFSGLRELAQELARRREQFPNLKMVVVGSGELDAGLAALRDKSLGHQLQLMGQRPVSEVPGYIGASDVCLLPALRTPAMEHIVPSKVGEYMELGKPVVATRLPGMKAQFGDLPGMLWIDRPEEALDHVARLERAPAGARSAAAALGKSCYSYANAHGDWMEITDIFRELLSSTIRLAPA